MANGKKDNGNTAAASAIHNPAALPEFADFEEESLSFPPYWNPSPPNWDDGAQAKAEYLAEVKANRGKWFHAMVIDVDLRDPEFGRYILQAEKDLECMQGSKEDAVPVKVKAGEFFTCSTYAGLPLDRYIGVRVLVQVRGQRDVSRPQPMWEFKLLVSPEDKKLLIADRKTRALAAVAKFRESRKQLAESNA